jgi:hypothetical protein
LCKILLTSQARGSCTFSSTVLYIIDIESIADFLYYSRFGPWLNQIKMEINRIYVYYISKFELSVPYGARAFAIKLFKSKMEELIE